MLKECPLAVRWKVYKSLNPYFNGTCSKSNISSWRTANATTCLNPYFNGTCSKRSIKMAYTTRTNSLNPYFNGTCSKSCNIESN